MSKAYFIGLDSVDGGVAKCHFAKSFFVSNWTGERCWKEVFTRKLDTSLMGDMVKGSKIEMAKLN